MGQGPGASPQGVRVSFVVWKLRGPVWHSCATSTVTSRQQLEKVVWAGRVVRASRVKRLGRCPGVGVGTGCPLAPAVCL